MNRSLSEMQKIAGDFIAHKVSPAYFARYLGELTHGLADQADESRKNHSALIRLAQAIFFMAPE